MKAMRGIRMNILITGASGFIGGYIVKGLIEKGHTVICLVRSIAKGEQLQRENSVSFIVGDITKSDSLKCLGDEYDIIFHLAAMGHVSAVSEEAYQNFVDTNVLGTENLINQFKGSKKLKKFIHFSSTAAMGPIGEPFLNEQSKLNPITPYQKSKYKSERVSLNACDEFGFPTVVIRPCMVYGVGGYGEFHKFCRLMKKGLFPKVGKGKNLTPLVNVKDVAQAAISAMDNGKCGEVYIIASEKSIPMDELRNLIVKYLNVKAPYIYVPACLGLSGAKILEMLCNLIGKEPVVTYRNIKSTVTDRTFLIDKAKKDLKYVPCITFEEGIRETIKWYQEMNRI